MLAENLIENISRDSKTINEIGKRKYNEDSKC